MMKSKGTLSRLITFITLFVLITSTQQVPGNYVFVIIYHVKVYYENLHQTVQHLFMESELTLNLSGASNEWTIKTDPNHIFYFSFLASDDIDEELVSSSLTVN